MAESISKIVILFNTECDLNLAMSNFWYKVSRGLKVWQSAQRLSSSAWSEHNVMVARTLEKQETLSKTHLISPSQHCSTGQIIKKSSVLFVCNKCWMYFMFLFSTLLLSSWTHRNQRIWSRLISWYRPQEAWATVSFNQLIIFW